MKEHFPSAAYGVYPIESDSKIAIIVVASKYSPHNFWWKRPPPSPANWKDKKLRIYTREAMDTIADWECAGTAAGGHCTCSTRHLAALKEPSR